MLTIDKSRIVFRYDAEELWLEPWGPNALRVRATKEAAMPGEDWALTARGQDSGEAKLTERGAELFNGKIRAEIFRLGKIMIYHVDSKLLLEEYHRNRRDILDSKCSAIEVEAGSSSPSPTGITT